VNSLILECHVVLWEPFFQFQESQEALKAFAYATLLPRINDVSPSSFSTLAKTWGGMDTTPHPT
jgi:hypothetical protein